MIKSQLDVTGKYHEFDCSGIITVVDGSSKLDLSVSNVDVGRFLEWHGVDSIPDGLQFIDDLNVEKVKLSMDTNGGVDFNIEITDKGEELEIIGITYDFQRLLISFRKHGDMLHCGMALWVDSVEFANFHDLEIKEFLFNFQYEFNTINRDRAWLLGAVVQAELNKQQFELKAALSADQNMAGLELQYHKTSIDNPLIDVAGFIEIDILSMKLAVNASAGKLKLDFESGGYLIIDAIRPDRSGPHKFEGKISIHFEDEHTWGVELDPLNSEPLSFPLHDLSKQIGILDFSFGKIGVASTAISGPSCRASVTLRCDSLYNELPDSVQNVISDVVELSFSANQSGASFTCDALNKSQVTLPDVSIDGNDVSLGTMEFGIGSVGISISSILTADVAFEMNFPDQLNNLFGKNSNGEYGLVLFKKEKSLGVTVSVSPEGAVLATLNSLPFDVGSVVKTVESGNIKSFSFDCPMGDYGAFNVTVPSLAWSGTKFSAERGGLKVTKDLCIPTGLLNYLVSPEGEGKGPFPKKVPLNNLSLLDDKEHLKVDEITQLWNNIMTGSMPKVLRDCLETATEITDRLPIGLKEYFHITIPEELTLSKFACSVAGDLELGVSVEPSIKSLIPVGTGFYGLTFRSLAFEELMAGQLLFLKLDLEIDFFDMPSVMVSLLNEKPTDLFPNVRSHRNSLVIKNLSVLIIYQGGVPIPVPIFFDNIEICKIGVFGEELHAKASFPQPELDVLKLIEMSSSFISFFADMFDTQKSPQNKYRLDENYNASPMDLEFRLDDWYIKLPDFMGKDKKIGVEGNVAELSAYKTVATTLNGMKFFDIAKVVPLQYRIGQESIHFIPLGSDEYLFSVKVAWVLATSDEIKNNQLPSTISLPDNRGIVTTALQSKHAEIKEILPANVGLNGAGAVLAMEGEFTFLNKLSFHALFAMISDETQFSVGYKFGGDIAQGLFAFNMQGVLKASKPDKQGHAEQLNISGKTSLRLLNKEVFSMAGALEITSNEVKFTGQLSLLPQGSPVQIAGTMTGYISADDFRLSGGINFSVFNRFTLAGAMLDISKDSAYITGAIAGVVCELQISKHGSNIEIRSSAGFHYTDPGTGCVLPSASISIYIGEHGFQQMVLSGSGEIPFMGRCLVRLTVDSKNILTPSINFVPKELKTLASMETFGENFSKEIHNVVEKACTAFAAAADELTGFLIKGFQEATQTLSRASAAMNTAIQESNSQVEDEIKELRKQKTSLEQKLTKTIPNRDKELKQGGDNLLKHMRDYPWDVGYGLREGKELATEKLQIEADRAEAEAELTAVMLELAGAQLVDAAQDTITGGLQALSTALKDAQLGMETARSKHLALQKVKEQKEMNKNYWGAESERRKRLGVKSITSYQLQQKGLEGLAVTATYVTKGGENKTLTFPYVANAQDFQKQFYDALKKDGQNEISLPKNLTTPVFVGLLNNALYQQINPSLLAVNNLANVSGFLDRNSGGSLGGSQTPAPLLAQPVNVYRMPMPMKPINSVDAALIAPDNKAYFFKGDMFIRYNFHTEKTEFVGRTGIDDWFGIPKKIDAAVMHPTNSLAYFFTGENYYRYNFKTRTTDAPRKIGRHGWKGLPEDGVDAVFIHPKTGNAYFYKGDKYYRYDFAKNSQEQDRIVIQGKQNKQKGWSGSLCVDASVSHPTKDLAYFFVGDEYYSVDYTHGQVVESGKSLEMLGGFIKIDAAFWHPMKERAYLFSGDEFYYYDPATGKSSEKYKITDKMHGVPSHLDAAVWHPKEQKLHCFKSPKYWVFDFKTETVDQIQGHIIGGDYWKGIPSFVGSSGVHLENTDWIYFNDVQNYYRFDTRKGEANAGKPLSKRPTWPEGGPVDAKFSYREKKRVYYFSGQNYCIKSYNKGKRRIIEIGKIADLLHIIS